MRKASILFASALLCLCFACTKDEENDDPIVQDPPSQEETEGALPGLFSIGEGRQIQFSKGNLQYQATTSTWRFAENQYDYMGTRNGSASPSYSGWIDLFGWGTSGWDSGNQYYMPYDHDYVDSYDLGMGYGPLPSGQADLCGEWANCDWGVYNAISNGGNKAGMWRTMNRDEWHYLINLRPNAAQKYGIACIEGNNGLVLLPDDWTLPDGCTFNCGTSGQDGMEYYSMQNSYSEDQWKKMESNGAVFLPAAGGRREMSEITYDGEIGRYWTVNCCSDDPLLYDYCAYALYFDSYQVLTSEKNNPRDYGRSVRVVKDVK